MKRILGIVGVACMLFACGNRDEERAQTFLAHAEQAWKAGDYNRAKLHIDSVRICYPKAFEARRQGVRLMQHVELDEQRRTIAYLDSVLQAKLAKLDSVKGDFVLEKDTAYQEVGNYFCPSQTVEKNTGRTFLRAQVSERGQMALTSIYCGAAWIHHTAVRATAGDLFAETPASTDIYETTDLGLKIEKADYPLGKDGGLAVFVAENEERPILLEYKGDRAFKTAMPAVDKKAVARIYTLAQLLSSIQQVRKDKQEAERKIGFITRKMQENEAE